MKKLIPFLLALTVILLCCPQNQVMASKSDTAKAYSVTASALNVRTGPSTGYTKIGLLPRGAEVTGIVSDGWLKFTYDGKQAYCSAKYLSEVPVSTKTASIASAVQVSLSNAAKPLAIHVSIEKQTLTVQDARGRVVKQYLCSTGSPGYDTPVGTFSVYDRGESFYSEKYQQGAYYYVAFYHNYLIHSVPFDKNGNIIQSIANDLGNKDSHGCVHLTVADSKWVYQNIPTGTKVIVD